MAKFLDGNGLSRLWSRIQTLVTSMIPDVSTKMNTDGSNANSSIYMNNTSRFTINQNTNEGSNGAAAFGQNTRAMTPGSFAEGYAPSGYIQSSGLGSHAEGYVSSSSGKIIASGAGSHAEGEGSYAYPITSSGQGSHAEGSGTCASNTGAHSEGYRTIASGKYSHAEGSGTCATGICAHSEGYGTTANGYYSHAGGYLSKASGSYQTAIGYRGETGTGVKMFEDGLERSLIIERLFSLGSSTPIYGSSNKPTTYGIFDIDEHGNIFLSGSIYRCRGKVVKTLVADVTPFILEPGAIYALYIAGWNASSKAFRGINSYVIAAGIGTSTTAQVVPKIASIGTAGTVCCRLSSTYSGEAGDYAPALGIGCCTTAITIRYTLVKVSGSIDDFDTAD